MKVEVDREDLKPRYQDRNCSQVGFEHLRAEVQRVVVAAGKATFYDTNRVSYNVVYPPGSRHK